MSNKIIATIRTYTPILAGIIITLLAKLGISVSEEYQTALDMALFGIASAGYYSLAQWLSSKFSWAGWLLGVNQQPEYQAPRQGDS